MFRGNENHRDSTAMGYGLQSAGDSRKHQVRQEYRRRRPTALNDTGVTYERTTRLTNNEIRELLYPDSTKHHEQGARRYWTLFHQPKPSKNLLVKEQVRILSLFQGIIKTSRYVGIRMYASGIEAISSVSVSGSYLTLVILREKLSRTSKLLSLLFRFVHRLFIIPGYQ